MLKIDWRDEQYFIGLLSGFGISTNSVTISPLGVQGDIQVSVTNASTDVFFDIGNVAVGLIPAANIATYINKVFYYGSLKLTSYYNAGSAGGAIATSQMWLSTGRALGITNFLVKQRAQAAVSADSNINSPENANQGFVDVFDDCAFSYIRKIASVGVASTLNDMTEYIFNGVQINYV